MKKCLLLCFLVVLLLGGTGAGYALWSETLYIDGTVNTGEVDWEWWNDIFPGEEPYATSQDTGTDPSWDKDVASTETDFEDTDGDGDYDLFLVTVDNAYPGYWNHLSTWVHCNGTVPIIIEGATLTYNGDDYLLPDGVWVITDDGVMRFKWGNNTGDQLHFCDERNMSFTFQVLQPAPQDSTLLFTISLVAVQWNEG